MKKLSLLIISFLFLFISGCSYKNTILQIAPYKVNFVSFKKQNKKIFIDKILDQRPDKSILAIVTNDNGDNLGYFVSTTDLIKWYRNALKKALNANGFEITNSKKDSSVVIDIKIKKLLATFNKSKLTKANLFGDVRLKLIIHTKNETITKNISEQIKSYNGLIVDDKDFEKEIKTLLSDSIKMIIKGLK